MKKQRGDVTREVRAVVKCLQALMLRDAAIACNSYTQFPDGKPLWNDDVWRAANYEGFRLHDSAKRAIRALAKACPTMNSGSVK